MIYPSAPLTASLWRMLAIRYQRDPCSGEGARLLGGRWNPKGMPALYLATDPATAVAEFYQGLPKPGILAPYRIEAAAIADLTDGRGGPAHAMVEHACTASWKAMAARPAERGEKLPPSWALARDLVAAGVEGALVPSVQNRGGTCLVLWRWHRVTGEGEVGTGAALSLLDPEGSLKE